jgi:hypothetical protein
VSNPSVPSDHICGVPNVENSAKKGTFNLKCFKHLIELKIKYKLYIENLKGKNEIRGLIF